MNSEHVNINTHLTETANKLFCRLLLEKCKRQISGGLDIHSIHSSIQVSK